MFALPHQVPMQYANPGGEQMQLALIMSPSSFPSGDQNYLGPVLFNPGNDLHCPRDFDSHVLSGGPDGSGVDYILTTGDLFRSILGPGYDLVSFDPRGTFLLVSS
jgi:hypothetical protein